MVEDFQIENLKSLIPGSILKKGIDKIKLISITDEFSVDQLKNKVDIPDVFYYLTHFN